MLYDGWPKQAPFCWDLVHGGYRIFIPGMSSGIIERSRDCMHFATSHF